MTQNQIKSQALIGEIIMHDKTNQQQSNQDESSINTQESTGDIDAIMEIEQTPIAKAVSYELGKDTNLPAYSDEATLEDLKRQIIENFKTIKNVEETFKNNEPLKMKIMQYFHDYIKTSGEFFYRGKSDLIKELKTETGVRERTLRHYINAAEFSERYDLEITEETASVIKTVCEVALKDQEFVLTDSLEIAKAEGLNFPTRKIVNACIKAYREKAEGKVGQKLDMIQNTEDKSKIEHALSTAKILLDLAINGDEFDLLSLTKTGLDKLVTRLEIFQESDEFSELT